MSASTTPHDNIHPLDWKRLEVSPRFLHGREFYPVFMIDVKKHALLKSIYDCNQKMSHIQ